MTRGYLRGQLSFKYPQPLSRLRENYLISFLERDEIAEVIRTRALLNSQYIGLETKDNMAKKTFDAFKEYAEILLPTKQKPAKIEEIQKDKLQAIRAVLKAAQAAHVKPVTK